MVTERVITILCYELYYRMNKSQLFLSRHDPGIERKIDCTIAEHEETWALEKRKDTDLCMESAKKHMTQ
jgi:hypothetical protein